MLTRSFRSQLSSMQPIWALDSVLQHVCLPLRESWARLLWDIHGQDRATQTSTRPSTAFTYGLCASESTDRRQWDPQGPWH
jgi:hypothetical protein